MSAASVAPAVAVPCPLCQGERTLPASHLGGHVMAVFALIPCPACCPEYYVGRRVTVRGPGGRLLTFAGPPGRP